MSAKELNQDTFEKEISGTDKPVLVDFWAPWCVPCRMQGPIVDELAEETTEFVVCKVNVDDNATLAEQYVVEAIPTLIVLKKGTVTARAEGVQSKEAMIEMLSR